MRRRHASRVGGKSEGGGAERRAVPGKDWRAVVDLNPGKIS